MPCVMPDPAQCALELSLGDEPVTRRMTIGPCMVMTTGQMLSSVMMRSCYLCMVLIITACLSCLMLYNAHCISVMLHDACCSVQKYQKREQESFRHHTFGQDMYPELLLLQLLLLLLLLLILSGQCYHKTQNPTPWLLYPYP